VRAYFVLKNQWFPLARRRHRIIFHLIHMNSIQEITAGEKDAQTALSEAKERAQKTIEGAEKKGEESLIDLEKTLVTEQQQALATQEVALTKKSEEATKVAAAEAETLLSATSQKTKQGVATVLTRLGF